MIQKVMGLGEKNISGTEKILLRGMANLSGVRRTTSKALLCFLIWKNSESIWLTKDGKTTQKGCSGWWPQSLFSVPAQWGQERNHFRYLLRFARENVILRDSQTLELHVKLPKVAVMGGGTKYFCSSSRKRSSARYARLKNWKMCKKICWCSASGVEKT